MAQFIRANSDFGDAFSRTFAQSLHYAQQEAERKRQEEANKAIAQMYLESMRAPADAAVAPYQQNVTNTLMQANTADSNLSAVNAPITTAPDRLADTRSLRFLSMTPEERAQAGITPEQSAQMNTAMQTEGPINMQQANAGVANTLAPIASQANNQAQSAEQMLAMAKEKYGTAMFDRLAPIVASGKVPAQAMISIIERQVQAAEKTALKQAQNQAYKQATELMKQGKFDEAKMIMAEYMTPEAQGRMMASMGQGAGIHSMVKLGNGNWGTVDKTGKITDTGTPFNAPVGRGSSGGGSGRPVNPNTHDPNSGLPLGAKEKWARTYENTGLIRDENLLAEYENYLNVYQSDPESVEGMAAKKWLDTNQRRVNIASDNRNQYWTISSGGEYRAGQSNTPAQSPSQPPQEETEEQRKQRLKAALGIQ